jgi:hypothetical protein
MPDRDPAKRITAIGTSKLDDGSRVILKLGDDSLIVGTDPLSPPDADLFCEGCVDGLRSGEHFSPEEICAVLNQGFEVTIMEVPLPADFTTRDRAFFNRGIAEGLKLAADGHWLDSRLSDRRERDTCE